MLLCILLHFCLILCIFRIKWDSPGNTIQLADFSHPFIFSMFRWHGQSTTLTWKWPLSLMPLIIGLFCILWIATLPLPLLMIKLQYALIQLHIGRPFLHPFLASSPNIVIIQFCELYLDRVRMISSIGYPIFIFQLCLLYYFYCMKSIT